MTSSTAGAPGDDRNETPNKRLDRHWAELLQELRVIQTGVQLLTGFLLTLPFQQRFTMLSDGERAVYVVTIAASIAATVFLQTPVVVHRALFRRHQRAKTVLLAHRLAIVGTALLSIAVTGVTCLIVSAVWDLRAGLWAAGGTFALLVGMWVLLPVSLVRRQPRVGAARVSP